MTAPDTHRAIDAVWRIESPRLIASLARLVRDVGIAEELAQDVFVIALEQWPASGIPERPGAWLMSAAKHRAIDRIRRNAMSDRKHDELGRELSVREEIAADDREERMDDDLRTENSSRETKVKEIQASYPPKSGLADPPTK